MSINNQPVYFLAGLLFTTFVITFYAPVLDAGTVTAQRGKFFGRVSITAAKANETQKRVEQSTTKAGTTYEDTGVSIDTNAAGFGSVAIPNVFSGTLLTGHNVRVICSGGTICGPAAVKKPKKWFKYFTSGIQQAVNLEIAQSNFGDDDLELLETWETNAIWTLGLDPTEASWIDTGYASINDSQGDLVASILSITSNAISFQIISDSTPLTSNSLFIDGVNLNVLPGITTINPLYGLTGDTSAYLDGNLLLSQSFLEGTVSAPSISAIPLPSAAWLFVSGIIGMVGLLKKERLNKT